MGVKIEVNGLTKSFGSSRIWEDVTLELPPGEVSVLLGPSGTGKSVFLKSLIGLLRPERGSIYIDGTDIIQCSAKELYEIRTLFGVMFQDGALFGSMNLFDNAAFPLREHTKKKESEIRDIVMEKLSLVGLGGDEKKFPGEISGGMRKRAGLARAMSLDPAILFFDEPSAGLDPITSVRLDELILRLRDALGTTIVVVTHELPSIFTIADTSIFLDAETKTMIAHGNPKELVKEGRSDPKVRDFLLRNDPEKTPIGLPKEDQPDKTRGSADHG